MSDTSTLPDSDFPTYVESSMDLDQEQREAYLLEQARRVFAFTEPLSIDGGMGILLELHAESLERLGVDYPVQHPGSTYGYELKRMADALRVAARFFV